jgi:hypothetical protein
MHGFKYSTQFKGGWQYTDLLRRYHAAYMTRQIRAAKAGMSEHVGTRIPKEGCRPWKVVGIRDADNGQMPLWLNSSDGNHGHSFARDSAVVLLAIVQRAVAWFA